MKRISFLCLTLSLMASFSMASEMDAQNTMQIVVHGKSKDLDRNKEGRQIFLVQGDVITLTKGLDPISQEASIKNGLKTTIADGIGYLDMNCSDGIYFLVPTAGSKTPELITYTCVNR